MTASIPDIRRILPDARTLRASMSMTKAEPVTSAATATGTAPILEFVGASKAFGGIATLMPFDLEVAPGETVALIGPSGCGKTTILRLALGLLSPDTGVIRFRGAVLTAQNVRALRQRMGYVVQEGGLFPHLTAAENIDLMARHLGWPAARTEERRSELVALTRFPADALDRYPLQLSGGQRQRVSLMRALLLDPELLLLDEPLGAIDPLVRAELQEDLARVFDRLGKAVILVTHDLAEAAFFAHRVVLLRQGRVVQRGRVEDLLRAPAEPFVARFVAAQRRLAVHDASDDGHERKAWEPVRRSAWPRLLPILLLVLAARAKTATAAGELRIGSKSFTESVILGDIATLTMATTGVPSSTGARWEVRGCVGTP